MPFPVVYANERSTVGTRRPLEDLAFQLGLLGDERCLPVKAHPHANAAEHKELGLGGFETQHRAQLKQLSQGVRPVQYPDLGTRHRLQDFAPPLVDQVGWRDDQSAWVGRLHHRCGADRHHGFACAHLRVDHHRRLVMVHQQLDGSLHRVSLGLERLAFEAIHDGLASLVHRRALVQLGIKDGWVL